MSSFQVEELLKMGRYNVGVGSESWQQFVHFETLFWFVFLEQKIRQIRKKVSIRDDVHRNETTISIPWMTSVEM